MSKEQALKIALEALELHLTNHEHGCVYLDPAVTAIKEALAQPEQEPVAWMVTSEMQDGTKNTYPLTGRYKDIADACDFGDPIPLYASPPQRKPLTDEQKVALCKQFPDHLTFNAIHAIEAAHGITGEQK